MIIQCTCIYIHTHPAQGSAVVCFGSPQTHIQTHTHTHTHTHTCRHTNFTRSHTHTHSHTYTHCSSWDKKEGILYLLLEYADTDLAAVIKNSGPSISTALYFWNQMLRILVVSIQAHNSHCPGIVGLSTTVFF